MLEVALITAPTGKPGYSSDGAARVVRVPISLAVSTSKISRSSTWMAPPTTPGSDISIDTLMPGPMERAESPTPICAGAS